MESVTILHKQSLMCNENQATAIVFDTPHDGTMHMSLVFRNDPSEVEQMIRFEPADNALGIIFYNWNDAGEYIPDQPIRIGQNSKGQVMYFSYMLYIDQKIDPGLIDPSLNHKKTLASHMNQNVDNSLAVTSVLEINTSEDTELTCPKYQISVSFKTT